MSRQSTHNERPVPELRTLVKRPLITLFAPVQFVGFWSAILLPFISFLMMVSGMASQHLIPFTTLILANIVALVIGRNYKN